MNQICQLDTYESKGKAERPLGRILSKADTVQDSFRSEEFISGEVRTYAELLQMMQAALIAQHPEWIEPAGESPMLALHIARLADLLALFEAHSPRAVT